MQLWKNIKNVMNLSMFIIVLQPIVMEAYNTTAPLIEFEKKFAITDIFRSFVELIVVDACQNKSLERLPEGFLRCYERMLQKKSTVCIADLIDAYPVLVEAYHTLAVQQRAPRPDAPGNTDGAPVGPLLGCDLGEIRSLVNQIGDVIRNCCAQLQQDFEFTWTILADILATATSIDFSDASTALQEFEDTLTACCAEIQQDFEDTWTILAEIQTTITVNFDGTFTVLQEILDSIVSPTVIVDFSGVFTVLAEIETTLTVNFDATFTALADLNTTLTECCADITADVQGVYTALADIQQTITTDFNGTFTSLTIILEGSGANLDAIISAGFNGTFTALADLKNTLTACCENLQQDFEDTWTILADIKQTLTVDFDGTFTLIEAIQAEISSGTIVIDVTPLFTVFAAGFNGTFTALADLLETITEDFDGTFTALDAASACFAMSLTGATVITSPGYYCLANDVSGAFTISANDVVLDLNNHTISTGGIFVLTGTNRTIKNGRLNSSSAGIVLTSNTRSIIENMSITNASAPGITFAGTHYDNSVRNVLIENGTIGLTCVNDTNLKIEDLTINGMTSVGMTFTSSNNLQLNNVSVLNTVQDGIDFNNPSYINVSNVRIYNARSYGIRAFGLANGCIFQNIAISIQNTVLNDGYNFENAQACLLRNCSFIGIGTSTVTRTLRGINITAGFANTLDSCTVRNLSNNQAINGILLDTNAQDNVVSNCVVQLIAAGGTTTAGILSNGVGNTFFNCSVIDISANTTCSGIALNGSCLVFNSYVAEIFAGGDQRCRGYNTLSTGLGSSLFNCTASDVTANTATRSFGFGDGSGGTGGRTLMKNCTARNAQTAGFNNQCADSMMYQCQARGSTSGFLNENDQENVFVESIATNNTTGFNQSTACIAYHCFAGNNTTNMTATVPNKQLGSASPVLAGSNVRFTSP